MIPEYFWFVCSSLLDKGQLLVTYYFLIRILAQWTVLKYRGQILINSHTMVQIVQVEA